MERGVLAIFGGISEASSRSLQSFVNFYNIPFFAWNSPTYKTTETYLDENDNEYDLNGKFEQQMEELVASPKANQDSIENVEPKEENNYFINMHPEIAPVLISLIKYNRHKTIYYMYNHDFGKYIWQFF